MRNKILLLGCLLVCAQNSAMEDPQEQDFQQKLERLEAENQALRDRNQTLEKENQEMGEALKRAPFDLLIKMLKEISEELKQGRPMQNEQSQEQSGSSICLVQ